MLYYVDTLLRYYSEGIGRQLGMTYIDILNCPTAVTVSQGYRCNLLESYIQVCLFHTKYSRLCLFTYATFKLLGRQWHRLDVFLIVAQTPT